MKKLVLALTLGLTGMYYCQAQLIHTKGIPELGMSSGFSSRSFIPGLSFQYHLSRSSRLGINARYDRIGFPLSRYQSFIVNPEYAYSLDRISRSTYFNLKGGLCAGFENAASGIFPSKRGVFFGENIGISLEYFLSRRFKIELCEEQFFFQRSLVLNADYYIGISLFKQLTSKSNKFR